jgi:hypothetical protein
LYGLAEKQVLLSHLELNTEIPGAQKRYCNELGVTSDHFFWQFLPVWALDSAMQKKIHPKDHTRLVDPLCSDLPITVAQAKKNCAVL